MNTLDQTELAALKEAREDVAEAIRFWTYKIEEKTRNELDLIHEKLDDLFAQLISLNKQIDALENGTPVIKSFWKKLFRL